MRNLANVKPSAALESLSQTAKLSNAVSRQALKNAQRIWSNYTAVSNAHRDPQLIVDVAGELRLIISQVAARRCRINPCCWHKLTQLEADLRKAFYLRLLLEPNVNVAAANDSASEVA